jgi:hypothetical protein
MPQLLSFLQILFDEILLLHKVAMPQQLTKLNFLQFFSSKFFTFIQAGGLYQVD